MILVARGLDEADDGRIVRAIAIVANVVIAWLRGGGLNY